MKIALSSFLLLLFFSLSSYAQFKPSLNDGFDDSYYYKINDQQALEVSLNHLKPTDTTVFNYLAYTQEKYSDSLPLPTGNYLKMSFQDNHITYEYYPVTPWRAHVLNNDRDLIIQILDLRSNIPLRVSSVKIGNKNIPYNSKTKSYILRKNSREGILAISEPGNTFYYFISTQEDRHTYKDYYRPKISQILCRIIYKNPVVYFTAPLRLYNNIIPDGLNSIMYDDKYGEVQSFEYFWKRYAKLLGIKMDKSNDIRTYFYFSKPIYRQGDTIKFKVHIWDYWEGQWYHEPILVFAEERYGEEICIGKIASRKTGSGYDFQFVIQGSFQIKLDRYVNINLKDLDSNQLGDGTFKYENYELKKSDFRIELTDGRVQTKGKPFQIKFIAKDENGLPMSDTRAQLYILTKEISGIKANQLFIPDTLWSFNAGISKGELKVLIPDSIFLDAKLKYQLNAVLQNSENERKQLTENIEFCYRPNNLKLELINDSVIITRLETDENPVRVYAKDRFDFLLLDTIVKPPFSFPLNTHASSYYAESETDNDLELDMRKLESNASVNADRKPDSISCFLHNPRNLPVVYHLFRNNKELKRGTQADFPLLIASDENSNYSFALEYIWAGKTVNDASTIAFYKKELKLNIEQPPVITPGKETEISITALDYNNNPVKDINLLAYSYTSKFDNNTPDKIGPFFSGLYLRRKAMDNFEFDKIKEDGDNSGSVVLNYPYWNEKMLLDTNWSYRFRYPSKDSMEFTHIAMADSVMQVAPFVVIKGEPQPIQYVYIDNIPVYFGFTDKKAPYSFAVDTNYHAIKIRTKQHLIILDPMKFKPYVKTLFSIDPTQNTGYFTVFKCADSFDINEKNTLARYIFKYSLPFKYLKYAYLESRQNRNRYFDISTDNYLDKTAGPLSGQYWNLKDYQGMNMPFEFEHHYSYSFNDNIIKMKAITNADVFPRKLSNMVPSVYDEYITEEKLLANYERQFYDERSKKVFQVLNDSLKGRAALSIDYNTRESNPVNIILGRPNEFNFIKVLPGNTTNIKNIPPGQYQLLLIDKYNTYRKTDIIDVKENGLNFYRILHTDTVTGAEAMHINQLLNELFWTGNTIQSYDLGKLMRAYMKATFKGDIRKYTGQVLSENGDGIPGALISVKGTGISMITDIDGKFEIDIPSNITDTLFITAIGHAVKTLKAKANMKVILKGGTGELQEIVIASSYGPPVTKQNYVGAADVIRAVGYKNMSGADITKMIEGAAPGVQVTNGSGEPGSGANIQIRGRGSVSGSVTPLIVLNGAPFDGNITELDPSMVESINILKDAMATSLYGARGSNGVIIITTKKGADLPERIKKGLQEMPPSMTEDLMVSSLRNNFRDDAYWQPDLVTDENGKASFKVKFPDDITNWKTLVIATDDKKHTGYAVGNIKSYKPVAASLYLPHFLLDGDSALLIGKAVNYIPDTIPATTTFYQNDMLKRENKIHLGPFHNDTLLLTATGADSIKLKYLLTKEDGYFDGEEKAIPLQRVGVKVAEGSFVVLDKEDTSFTIYPARKGDTLHLSATASLIDVLLDEVNVVRDYGYMCNEQKASKILAFLGKQKMYTLLQKPFEDKDRKYVQHLIDKIIKSRNEDHQWGWWDESQTIPWISNHVLKTLMQAKTMGYNCNIDIKAITDAYVFNLERDTMYTDLPTLQLLAEYGVALNYEKYISRLERNRYLTLNASFELILLRQKLHLPYKLDKLTASKESDIFGNIYWKDTAQFVYNNEVLTTLNAFKIIQNDTSTGISSPKVINWLIQQRTASGWRNTYESANIIEALATSIPLGNKDALKPVLQFNGGINENTTQFPYKKDIVIGSAVQVQKSGYAPVYFSWYYNKRDTSNTKLGNNFKLQSSFENTGKRISTLPAGVPVMMKVNVHVEKSAEFVMIEIPIPAGCSYQSKAQFYSNHEIHREYFEDRVSIFCEELPKGDYEYTIELLPRYQGSYTLNPAKAELMYFPVFYGRAQIKRIDIKD